jgi:hypothetical protein
MEGNAMTNPDVFTTATAGLKEVLSPRVLRLRDGDRLDLDISPVRKSLRGAELRMLAYNGSVPGPTLHVEQGSQITVHTRNDGDVETTVHWHGLRLENRYEHRAGAAARDRQAATVRLDGGGYGLPVRSAAGATGPSTSSGNSPERVIEHLNRPGPEELRKDILPQGGLRTIRNGP